MSIRTVLAIAIGGLVSIALAATICLVLFTSELRQESRTWTSAAEGIQIGEGIELDLLRHNRLRAPASAALADDAREQRNQLEHALSTRLEAARAAAETDREREIVARATAAVKAYLAAPHDPALIESRLTASLASLDELEAFNIAEAESASAQVAHWNRLANVTGIAAAVLLLIGMTATFAWVRAAAFLPLFGLRHAIERFSGGDRNARAEETGPPEIRDIAEAFNRMAEELAAHTRRQFTFLAGVAHDLRAPLQPLKMAAHLGRQPGTTLDVPQARHMLDIVGRQVEQLERMTTDLLEAARIEAGRLEIRPEPCDLRGVAQTVAELFTGPGHRLDVVLPDQPVVAPCDPVRIQQVLTNLVSNAVKYSPDGGTITIAVRDDGDRKCIAVTDEGIGIPEDDLPYIFEPFRRAAGVETTVAGAGLGLSISRRLVLAHGGRLDVVSLAGVGSTFTITLPAAASAQLAPASAARRV